MHLMNKVYTAKVQRFIQKVGASYCFFIAMSLEILYVWKQSYLEI